MVLNYHDGMAICREYGAPNLFVTFTCNPKWQEVVDALAYEGGQTHVDRPDVVTRAFNIKFEEFLEDVKDGSAFGAIQACELLFIFPTVPLWSPSLNLILLFWLYNFQICMWWNFKREGFLILILLSGLKRV